MPGTISLWKPQLYYMKTMKMLHFLLMAGLNKENSQICLEILKEATFDYKKHYFSYACLYNNILFQQQFQMCQPLFLKIKNAVEKFDPYIMQKPNTVGRIGFHALVKTTASWRMLAYGGAGGNNNGYLKLSETTSLQCMDCFCKAIVAM